MKRCLILGGAGFLGVNLVYSLLKRGKYHVRVYNRESSHLNRLSRLFPELDVVVGDFVSERRFPSILEDTDIVFHLVSTTMPSNRDIEKEFEENVLPTIRFLNACREKKIRVIFFSSGGTVYGLPQYMPIDEKHRTDPVSGYGIHKLTIEKCIEYYGRTYGLEYRILRISNPYGVFQNPCSTQGVVAVFLGRVLMEKPIEVWGDGNIIRDYVNVSDVVAACIDVMEYAGKANIFNVSSGVGYSLFDVLDMIGKVTGRTPDVRYLPGRIQDVPINILDNSLLYRETGWKPCIDFKEGVREMMMSWDEGCHEYMLRNVK